MPRRYKESPPRAAILTPRHDPVRALRSSSESHLNRLEDLLGGSVRVSYTFHEMRVHSDSESTTSDSASPVGQDAKNSPPLARSTAGDSFKRRCRSARDTPRELRRKRRANMHIDDRRTRTIERKILSGVRTVRACICSENPPRMVTSPRGYVTHEEAIEVAALIMIGQLADTEAGLEQLANFGACSPRLSRSQAPTPSHGLSRLDRTTSRSAYSSLSSSREREIGTASASPRLMHDDGSQRRERSASLSRSRLSLSGKLRAPFRSFKTLKSPK